MSGVVPGVPSYLTPSAEPAAGGPQPAVSCRRAWVLHLMMLFVGLAAVASAPHRPEAVAAAADGRVQASEEALTSLLLWPRRLQDDTPPPPSPQPPPPSPPRWPPPDLSQPFRPSFYALVIGSPLTIALVTAAGPHILSGAVRRCPVPAMCPRCPDSAAAPPQGAAGGSGRLNTPRPVTGCPHRCRPPPRYSR